MTYEQRQRRREREGIFGILAVAVVLFVVIFIALACQGCKATGTAVRIEQRRVVGITSAEIAEYTIPVISIGEGPSVSAYQSKDVPSTVKFNGTATTTNRTSILWGMYDSDERKFFKFWGKLGVGSTNGCDCARNGNAQIVIGCGCGVNGCKCGENAPVGL